MVVLELATQVTLFHPTKSFIDEEEYRNLVCTDHFAPSAHLTAPEFNHAFNMRAVFKYFAFSSYFSEPMLINTSLSRLFHSERSLPLLKESRNSINY